MTKKQYFILIVVFLIGTLLSRLVYSQEITGPKETLAGDLVILSVVSGQ